MKHVIKRVAATPLRIKSDMSWLGLARGRVSSMCLVEVETDSGIVGHGLTYLADGSVVAQAVNAVAAPAIVGMPVLATERIWSTLWWTLTASVQTGYGANAISAVDLALWDIKGQALGLPVWQLLGGAHERVPVYATLGLPSLEPEQVVGMARHLAALRKAFDDMVKDKETTAEFEKQKQELTPVSGQEIQNLMDRLYKTPKEIIAKADKAMEWHGTQTLPQKAK